MNINFSNFEEITGFLLENKIWEEWEVVNVQLSNNAGADLTLNTKINDPSGLYQYQLFKKVKPIVQSFIKTNEAYQITLNLKLKAPYDIHGTFDLNNEYYGFFINFHSSADLSVVNVTQLEKSLETDIQPIELWRNYIQQIYEEWKNSLNPNN